MTGDADDLHSYAPWQYLYFLPLPQGHGSFRPIFFAPPPGAAPCPPPEARIAPMFGFLAATFAAACADPAFAMSLNRLANTSPSKFAQKLLKSRLASCRYSTSGSR